MRLLSAGCSFSTCSSNISDARIDPESWAHHLVNHYGIDRFANLSMPGAGNTVIVNNLIYYLESKPDWNPTNTLVGFNITELHRTDVMCSVDNPYRNEYFSWAHDLNYNWINNGPFTKAAPPFNGLIQKNMEFEQIIRTNCLELVKLFTYLEYRNFSYFFMLIDDTVIEDSPDWFHQTLEKYKHRQALSLGMAEFAKQHQEVTDDNWHPSKYGQELIANEVISFLNQNRLTRNLS